MSLIGRSVAFAAATLLIVAATGVAGTNHREHAVVTPHSPEAEVRRIHAHFDSVLAELLMDVSPADAAAYLPQANAVQRLVSPAEMGELFKAIALTKGVMTPLVGFSRGDRRHSL